MDTYQERLLAAMASARVDRKSLAKHLGIAVQSVGQVLNGDSRMFDAVNHSKACELLGCRPVWLATGSGPMRVAAAPGPLTAEEPPRPYMDLRATVAHLGRLLAEHDELVRSPSADLLASLARNPALAAEIARMIDALIGARGKRAA